MSLQKIILEKFDKKGYRWIVSLLFMLASFYKTKTINRFKYNKVVSKWMQYHKNICYYIDRVPIWGYSISSLEQLVNNVNFIQFKPKNGDIIIDIGAGVGSETIIYSMKVGSGKVYAIEAHPDTYDSLFLLKKINNYENIIVSNIAISNEKGILYIESRDSHVENSIWRDNTNGIPINAITLDEYVNINGIKKINFLKMNIEAAEIDAIKGMIESIKIVDYIAISCHDFLFEKNTTEIKDTVTEFLEKNNFKVIFQKTGHIVYDSWVYGEKINVQ